jgi:hypothetical protein
MVLAETLVQVQMYVLDVFSKAGGPSALFIAPLNTNRKIFRIRLIRVPIIKKLIPSDGIK